MPATDNDMFGHVSVVRHEGPWTRAEAAASPDRLFIFTDNTDRDSGKGVVDRSSVYYRRYGNGRDDLHYPTVTAAVLRGLDNAFPVSTQRWYHPGASGVTGRWNDADRDEFEAVVTAEFADIRAAILAGIGNYREVVLPEHGLLGGRISQLTGERTPELTGIVIGANYSLDRFVENINEISDTVASGKAVLPDGLREGPALDDTIKEAVRAFVMDDAFSVRTAGGLEVTMAGLLARYPDRVRKEALSFITEGITSKQTIDMPNNAETRTSLEWFAGLTLEKKGEFLSKAIEGESVPPGLFSAEDKNRIRDMVTLVTSDPDITREEGNSYLDSLFEQSMSDTQRNAVMAASSVSASPAESVEAAPAVTAAPSVTARQASDWFHSLDTFAIVSLFKRFEFPDAGVSAAFDAAFDAVSETMRDGWTEGLDAAAIRGRLLGLFDGFDPSVKVALYESGRKMDLTMKVSSQQAFDVYTLGTSKRTIDEFLSLVPDGVTAVVDIRNYVAYNKHLPWFAAKALTDSLRAKGITYTHIGSLSGVAKTPDVKVAGKKDVVDYAKVAATPEFRSGYSELRQVINRGGKVLVISSEGNPSVSQRALLVGQALARDGINVGHISTDRHGDAHVYSQDAVVRGILGQNRIIDGSSTDIYFESDKTWHAGDNVRMLKTGDNVNARLIDGNWNFGRSVDIQEDDSKEYKDGYAKLAKKTDFTVVFTMKTSNGGSIYDRDAMKEAGHDGTKVTIPDDPDVVRDPVFAKNLAERISNKLGHRLVSKFAQDPESVDFDNVKLHIAGSDVARITVKHVNQKVSEDELAGAVKETFRKTGGAEAGFKLDDQTGVTQEDVNILVRNVLEHLSFPERDNGFEVSADEYRLPYRVTEVWSNGNTGVAEAAILAAQSLGLHAGILAPAGYRHIIDNETLTGRTVSDKAMFMNRFHLGERNAITREDIQAQVDIQAAESHRRELDLAPGLSDRQILILSAMGFSNSDILTMIDLADENGVVVSYAATTDAEGNARSSCARDLLNFIELCGGYGVTPVDPLLLSEEVVAGIERQVEADVAEDRKRGIGYITVNSPDYPDSLLAYEGFTRRFTEEEYRIDPESGVASSEVVRKEVTEERPAVLRYMGDPRALRAPSVAVLGGRSSSEESRRFARIAGGRLERSGIAVYAPLREPVTISHSVRIEGFENDEVSKRQQYLPAEGVPNRVLAREDSQSAAFNEAVRTGGLAVVFTPNDFGAKSDAEQVDRIAAAGGLVLTEVMPWTNPTVVQDERYLEARRARTQYFAAVSAGTALLLDGVTGKSQESPIHAAKAAEYGRYAVTYPGTEGVYDRLAANEEAVKEGFLSVETSGAGLDRLIGEALGRSKDTEAEAIQSELSQKEAEDRFSELHPDRFPFKVIRQGNSPQVFVVPERYPDVRESVKAVYGKDVIFSDNEKEAIRTMRERRVTVYDTSVPLFTGYAGTQIQEEPVYSVPLFYHSGNIYTLSTAPDDTPGLIPQYRRDEQRRLFNDFKEKAAAIQRKLQAAAGFPGTAPVHFENALYPVIAPNSVSIYEGDALRARVFISANGSIRIQNEGRLVDDLQEHAQRRDPFFGSLAGGFVNKVTVDALAIMMEMRLMGTSIVESDMYSLADREALAEIKEKIEQGWEKPSADNVDVASTDINHGEAAGLLAKPGETQADRTEVVKALMKEEAGEYKAMKAARKKESDLEKQIADIQAARDEAYVSGQHSDSFKAYDEKLETLNEDLAVIHDEVTSHLGKIAKIGDMMLKVVSSASLTVVESGAKATVVSIDGESLKVPNGPFTKAIEQDVAPLMEKIASEAAGRDERVKSQDEMETADLEGEAIRRTFDTVRKPASAPAVEDGYALKSEIKPGTQESEGRYIVSRDGKEAYATMEPDGRLRLASQFYDMAYDFKNGRGCVMLGGKFNYIKADGGEHFEVWIDRLGRFHDGFAVVVRDGLYNHVGWNGKLLSEDWCGNCRDFHDGLAVIMAGPDDPEGIRGKFNYVNTSGNVMFPIDRWLDDAGDFKDGFAVVKSGGRQYRIDTEGRDQGIWPPDGGVGGGATKFKR